MSTGTTVQMNALTPTLNKFTETLHRFNEKFHGLYVMLLDGAEIKAWLAETSWAVKLAKMTWFLQH